MGVGEGVSEQDLGLGGSGHVGHETDAAICNLLARLGNGFQGTFYPDHSGLLFSLYSNLSDNDIK